MTRPIWVILGPTASGKTQVGMELASMYDMEIVSLDSRQLYVGMNIGTAKPTAEQLSRIPHHMIDVITPDVRWDAMTYAREARLAIDRILTRGRMPLVVGGSGFYYAALSGKLNEDLPPRDEKLRAELHAEATKGGSAGLWARLQHRDPVTAARLHPHDTMRIIRALEVMTLTGSPLSVRASVAPPTPWGIWRVAVLAAPRDLLKMRIGRRVKEMIRLGWRDEVRTLLAAGYERSSPGLSSLGYPEMIAHAHDGLPLEQAVERISCRTWQYARRQLTWCRRVPPDRWVTAVSPDEAASAVAACLAKEE